MPFRFGVITLTESPQAFVRIRVELENGVSSLGWGAELLAPKWFDKNTALSNEDNYDQLRTSVQIAAEAYTADPVFRRAFSLFEESYPRQIEECQRRDLNRLVAGYGPALLDRAILDALCRSQGLSFQQGIQANIAGISRSHLIPDLDLDVASFLRGLKPRTSVHARHTVGLLDPISESDLAASDRICDGLPETLEEVVSTYGNRFFKIKVQGQLEQDLDRLVAVASALDQSLAEYAVTLDGNEQYDDVDAIVELWHRMADDNRLKQFFASILWIEQPLSRSKALGTDLSRLSRLCPVIIDESDEDLEAFPLARQRGYRGVSSKICKGLYKSILNKARCQMWNREEKTPRYFLSAEDLSVQAGIALQQDLALVSLLGIEHLERNGHHYAKGMVGAPPDEQIEFLQAHPDLYEQKDGAVCVRLRDGKLELGSLDQPGFARTVDPDEGAMKELAHWTAN
jgi:hypothetical protein